MTSRLSARLAAVVAALPVEPHSRVLEIGCGPGAAARALVARVPTGHVLGVDRAPAAVRQAVAGSADLLAGGRLAFRCVAAEDLELDDGEAPYDVVLAVRVGALDGRHPVAGERVRAALGRVTAPGARLFVDGGDPLREVALDLRPRLQRPWSRLQRP